MAEIHPRNVRIATEGSIAGSQVSVTFGGNGTLLLGRDKDRTAFFLSGWSSDVLNLSMVPNDGTKSIMRLITPTGFVYYLFHERDFGDLVHGPVFGRFEAGPVTVYVLEVYKPLHELGTDPQVIAAESTIIPYQPSQRGYAGAYPAFQGPPPESSDGPAAFPTAPAAFPAPDQFGTEPSKPDLRH
jgi:hypothetical protein